MSERTYILNEETVVLVDRRYPNGRRGISIEAVDGEPICHLTTNVAREPLQADEVLIKDWSENEGMLNWAVVQGIATAPHRYVSSGHVSVPVCKLLI